MFNHLHKKRKKKGKAKLFRSQHYYKKQNSKAKKTSYSSKKFSSLPFIKSTQPIFEPLTFAQAQKTVQIELQERLYRIETSELMHIKFDIKNQASITTNKKDSLPTNISDFDSSLGCDGFDTKSNIPTLDVVDGANFISSSNPKVFNSKEGNRASFRSSDPKKVNTKNFAILESYDAHSESKEKLPTSHYYRHVEKCSEEIDREYDMDEEDICWLDRINKQRKRKGLGGVITANIFEQLMDFLERESFFESKSSSKDPSSSALIDENAVCCICNDGECSNCNVILFCDMCNLPVHQECYGVPYVPEGLWLCRVCLQSPSVAVDCALCPNRGGAFKQIQDTQGKNGGWAHVVCALWIREISFANPVFLEPIEGINLIPAARWKLVCYICKQKFKGACIQCHKLHCYTAFHVTCAQLASLYMIVEPVTKTHSVRKIVYCVTHTPSNLRPEQWAQSWSVKKNANSQQPVSSPTLSNPPSYATCYENVRKARKILAEKRLRSPDICLPSISMKTIQKIPKMEEFSGFVNKAFIHKLISYWMQKRQSRSGVPLLRSLLARSQTLKNNKLKEMDQKNLTTNFEVNHCRRLRQDLEKARLLAELTRKRERMKRELVNSGANSFSFATSILRKFYTSVLESLRKMDTYRFFHKPVDINSVKDYYTFIHNPMDFSKMQQKINHNTYSSLSHLESDVDLIISNCLTYNSDTSIYGQSALSLQQQFSSFLPVLKDRYESVQKMLVSVFLNHDLDKEHKVEILSLEEEQPFQDSASFNQTDMPLNPSPKRQAKRRGRKRKVRPITLESNETSVCDVNQKIEVIEEMPSPQPPTNFNAMRLNASRNCKEIEEGEESIHPDSCSTKKAEDCVNSPQKVTSSSFTNSTTENFLPLVIDECDQCPSANPSPPHFHISDATDDHAMIEMIGSKPSNDTQPSDHPPNVVSFSTPKSSLLSLNDDFNETKSYCSKSSLQFVSDMEEIISPVIQKERNEAWKSSDPPLTNATRDLDVTSLKLPILSTNSECHESRKTLDCESLIRDELLGNIKSYSCTSTTSLFSSSQISCENQILHSVDDTVSSTTQDCSLQDVSSSVSYDSSIITNEGASFFSAANSFNFLDVVWAKCAGYPWYPAIIMNSCIGDEEVTHHKHIKNGLPIPPAHVLDLKKNKMSLANCEYLVLFFDLRRTWQWLPSHKIHALGKKSSSDKMHLRVFSNASTKFYVKSAYNRALKFLQSKQ